MSRRHRASRGFVIVQASVFGVLFLVPLIGLPISTRIGAIAIVPAASAAYHVWLDQENTPQIIPAQGQTLLAFLLYAFGVGIGQPKA